MRIKYPFQTNIELRFSDFDSIGHVKQHLYFIYFEEGRKSLFNGEINGPAISGLTFNITQLSCQYISPIRFEDLPYLKLGISSIEDERFSVIYEIFDTRGRQKVFCKGSSIHVCYNYTHRKEIHFSDEVKMVLQKFKLIFD